MEEMKSKIFRFSQVIMVICIASCVLLSAALVAGVWGRYFSQAEGESGARVAQFAFDVKDAGGDFVLDLSGITHPGTKKEYTFDVTNEKGKVSEVAQLVSAKLTLEGQLPLRITLKKGSEELIVLDSVGIAEADILSFAAGESGSQTLTLTVEWPEEQNSASFSEQTARVAVALTAAQID